MDERVAIVGAGTIGVGWAIAFARAGLQVALHDVEAERLREAPALIRSRLEELAAHGLLPEPPGLVAGRVVPTSDLHATLAGAFHVQESAPEDVERKRELFAKLDALAPPGAVLASSSSTIPCSRFADELPGRARCLVAHPGNPPFLLPVVELVPAPFTEPATVERAEALYSRIGMSVVRLRKEIEGFVFNRLQGALLREAYCLVRDGVVGVDDLDRVVRDGLGRRWAFIGPFETADLNTRGGIEAHAQRLGPMYERMGAERGQHDPWRPELVRRVAQERRRLLPLDRWEERAAWRDRMLMALEALLRGAEAPAARSSDPTRSADRLEIASLLHGYCAMLDRMELEAVPLLFTEDCVVAYGPDERLQSVGSEALARSLRRLWRFVRTSHHLSNLEISFSGSDEALVRSYVLAWHQRPDGSSNTLYAEYRDRVVRTEAGWRIAERRQLTHGSDEPWDIPLAESERRHGEP